MFTSIYPSDNIDPLFLPEVQRVFETMARWEAERGWSVVDVWSPVRDSGMPGSWAAGLSYDKVSTQTLSMRVLPTEWARLLAFLSVCGPFGKSSSSSPNFKEQTARCDHSCCCFPLYVEWCVCA